MRIITILGLAFILTFISCKTTKKAAPIVQAPVTAIKDSVMAPAEPVVRETYRETNTRLSDIIHTRAEVSFDWTNSRMRGKATLTVKAHFYPTRTLFLDARGMEIKSIELFEAATLPEPKKVELKKGEQPAQAVQQMTRILNTSFKYENDSIKIDLGKIFTEKQTYNVVIEYVAKPNELKSQGGSSAITDDKGLYFINPTGENLYKMPQIWTQGETQATSVWLPTIDSPNEKMTQEILMTVEDRFTTLSNGLLVASTKGADGTRIDHWKLDQPHAPYLAMMAVGEFIKVTDEPWNGKEISYYVEKTYEPHAKAIFGETKEMIDFFSNTLGVPYPWGKYAQIAVRDYVSGAMENTSATLHGDFVVYQTERETIDEKKGIDVISHELFHQWFGDLVTAESWSNLPLNESFATYGEYLWQEYKNGRDAADYHSWQSRQGYLRTDGEKKLVRFNYKDKEDMFDAFSYNKGGQVLHMLRKAVGDTAFFASLKNYLESNKYKAGEIHHLRLAFEETTGRDMNWFFNQWFLDKGRPKLKVTKKYDAAKRNLEITVEQNQDLKNVPLYRLPLFIDIYETEKPLRKHVVINEQKQVFNFNINSEPKLVNFDGERQLLCDLEFPKTEAEYLFQYKNAPLYDDRYEALTALESKINEQEIFTLFTNAATSDKFYALRNYAISKLEKVREDRLLELKTTFMNIYNTDKKTLTRARALKSLNKRFLNDPDVLALNERALNEQSYAICGEAVDGLTKRDPKMMLGRSKMYRKETGKDLLFPLANLYANHGGDEHIQFFHEALPYVNGFEVVTFLSSYVKTAKRCTSSVSAISAAMDFETLSKGANKFNKFAILKALKDLGTAWEAKEKSAITAAENARRDNKDVAGAEENLKTATETKEILDKMYNRSK